MVGAKKSSAVGNWASRPYNKKNGDCPVDTCGAVRYANSAGVVG